MPRPANKKKFIEQSELNFNKTLEFADEFPKKTKSRTYKNNELNDRDKIIADVIHHLHGWHLMMKNIDLTLLY